MMLCKADFEELFPEAYKPKRRAAASAGEPRQADIIRWAEDGGGLGNIPHRHKTPVGQPKGGASLMPAPKDHAPLSVMPAAAVYGAAWAMLASFGQMARV